MRYSYSACLSMASRLGKPANFMRSSISTCASIAASLISTWASGSESANIPPSCWPYAYFYNFVRLSLSLSSSRALRRAFTLYSISCILASFLACYYYCYLLSLSSRSFFC